MNKDGWSGLVLLALAGGYYWATGAIPDSTLEDQVGAVGLPHALAIALAVLGLILAVRGFMAARAEAAAGNVANAIEDEERDAGIPRALGFLAFGAGYVLLLPYIGYFLAVALLIGSVALYEGAPKRWTVPVAALGGALLYWAVFVKLLGVNQPVGTLFGGLI